MVNSPSNRENVSKPEIKLVGYWQAFIRRVTSSFNVQFVD